MSSRWYVLNVISGSEIRAKVAIERQIALKGLSSYFREVKVLDVDDNKVTRRGVVVSGKKSLLPGYIMLDMEMAPVARDLVVSASGGAFLGSKDNPIFLSGEEVDVFCERVRSQHDNLSASVKYSVGDNIKVIEGPFKDFFGVVRGVDFGNLQLKVSILVFNKDTEIMLGFNQVKVVE